MALQIDSEFWDGKHKYVNYFCDVCGYWGTLRKSHYKNGVGCSVCGGKTVKAGFNDIATTRPDLIQFFADTDDAYTHTEKSLKRVNCRCPTCGIEKEMAVCTLSNNGFSCPICSDGISFPNRYMAAFLKNNNIEFKAEKLFSWSGKRQYDFYIPDRNIIIEVNGLQHYREAKGWCNKVTFEQMKEIDRTKMELALNNGITDYFVVPITKSTFSVAMNSIINSGIIEYLGIDKKEIDWNGIGKQSLESLASKCLKLWNSGNKDTNEISKILNVSQCTVSKYLKKYAEIGMCEYSRYNQILKCQKIAAESRKRKVKCVTTGKVFDSIRDAANKNGIKERALQNCLAGRCKRTNNMEWKYIN